MGYGFYVGGNPGVDEGFDVPCSCPGIEYGELLKGGFVGGVDEAIHDVLVICDGTVAQALVCVWEEEVWAIANTEGCVLIQEESWGRPAFVEECMCLLEEVAYSGGHPGWDF